MIKELQAQQRNTNAQTIHMAHQQEMMHSQMERVQQASKLLVHTAEQQMGMTTPARIVNDEDNKIEGYIHNYDKLHHYPVASLSEYSGVIEPI